MPPAGRIVVELDIYGNVTTECYINGARTRESLGSKAQSPTVLWSGILAELESQLRQTRVDLEELGFALPRGEAPPPSMKGK